jgi:hypothetical protein
VERVWDLARSTDTVWPQFHMRDQVLILTLLPSGPVFLVGDSIPPPEFRWMDGTRRIAMREGVPPPWLTRLQIAETWNGRQWAATVAPVPPGITLDHFASSLIHEAFHTHQHRVQAADPLRFIVGGNAQFPDSSLRAIALLNLEGHFLAKAVLADNALEIRSAAGLACAIRRHRCLELGSPECERQRALEIREGTATYVTAAVLGSLSGTALNDSLSRALTAVKTPDDLARGHYYNSGFAWLLLLGRLGVYDWRERVELAPPDQVLAEAIGTCTGAAADSLFDAALTDAGWENAQASAVGTANLILLGGRQEFGRKPRIGWASPWDRW